MNKRAEAAERKLSELRLAIVLAQSLCDRAPACGGVLAAALDDAASRGELIDDLTETDKDRT